MFSPSIAGNCSPCHVGANAKSGHLDSAMTHAKIHIDEIVKRIQLTSNRQKGLYALQTSKTSRFNHPGFHSPGKKQALLQ